MKKRLAARFLLLVFLASLTALALSVAFAWFSNTLESGFGATSYVHKSYFESGDGTATLRYNTGYDAGGNSLGSDEGVTSEVGCAFEIRYPLQLYYFAWLQNLGYFNTPDETTGEIAQVHFYISADLDMSDYVLPPIGTAEYPFLGTIDGNGHTITNLHIINEESELTDVPDSAEEDAINPQIVGFFGVVGSYGGSAIASDGTASVSNMILNGVNIETSDPTDGESLIGVAAGYVNGVMSGVAVANSTVTVASGVDALGVASSVSGGGTSNLSDYGLVGYCTEPYMLDLNVTKVSLAAPVETQNVIYKNLQNEGPGFGGSIKMDDLFTRLTNIKNSASRPTTAYPTAQTVVYDAQGNEISRTTTATATLSNNNGQYKKYYSSDTAGSYYFGDTVDDVTNYTYLYQETLTATVIRYTGETKRGFTVSNGTYYMNLSSSNALEATSSASTKWVLENGRLYAYSQINGNTYYLNRGTNNALTPGTSASTTNWTRNADDTLSYTYNNQTWYLVYNGGWVVRPGKESFTIRSNGNYLNRSSNTAVTGGTSAASASEWYYDPDTGYVSIYYNNAVYYLNGSAAGAITLSNSTTNRTSWTKDDGTLSYTSGGVTWYLRYNGGWSAVPGAAAYRITDGTYYLGNTGTTLTAVASGNATDWYWDATNGRLYTVYNNAVYYLNATNAIQTLSTTASTTWTRDDSGRLSYNYNNRTWYLYREGTTWKVYPYDNVSVISQGGNYLNIASTSTVNAGTNANDATLWNYNNGAISTYYNNNTYYLNASGASVSVSTTQSTTWTKNNNGTLSYTDNNVTWYLVYSAGWKAYPSLYLVTVHDGTDYLAPSGTTAVTNSANSPAYWIADGNKLYTVIGTTSYYLRAQTTGLSLSTAANGTNFTFDDENNRYYCTIGTTTYYVVYNGTTWTVSTSTVGSGPIAVASGNTTRYLNRNGTTGVTQATTSNTNWTFDTSTGKIYTEYNGTTYYLRGVLAATQTRSTTNLALTTNPNDSGTTWSFANNNLSCAISVTTGNTTSDVNYYLTLDTANNNTIKLMDTSKNYFTLQNYQYSRYLNTTDADSPALDASSTTDTSATLWSFSNADTPGRGNSVNTSISTVVRGITRYLSVASSGASLTNNSNTLRYYRTDNNTARYFINNASGTRYYLYVSRTGSYNNYTYSWATTSTSNNNYRFTRTEVEFTNATVTISGGVYETEKENETISANTVFADQNASTFTFTQQNLYTTLTYATVSSATLTLATADVPVLRNDGTRTENSSYATAFPINIMDTGYDVNPTTNTGYIVGGGFSAASGSGRGDIRVSQYNINNIYAALGYTSTTNFSYSDARLEVITGMDNGTYSGWYRVSDTYNVSNSSNNVNTNVSNAAGTKVNYKTLGLKRYEDARASMSKSFTGATYIKGLHFMNTSISKDNVVRLPYAYIESTEPYEDYPVPNSCIDFNVKRRGFITVFAGTYYSTTVNSQTVRNNAFFSLHRIFRDDDNEITDIKEISQIYKPADGDDFIYKYTDGTYSDGKSASDCGSLAFDMKYMTNPTNFVNNAVYYFEIPVNGGEFALGSVSGKEGAYLFYLDIAANGGQAEDKDRITISERFTEQNYDVTLPAGVQLIDENGAFDAQRPYETVTVALADGYNGAYTFTRTGSVFTYNAAANTELTYIGGALTASNGQGTTVNYYPNGYTVTTVENITDTGRTTNLVEKMRIETVDAYDEQGAFESRTVTVYTGVDITDDPADFVEIVSFTYDPSTHANMKTRIVRAASSGGFNVVF
ncbi:MAG: hypothetical protein IKS88_03450, partial [Clostridia bacterium]|nr:hypothetical protein [Clostridia bacterium]